MIFSLREIFCWIAKCIIFPWSKAALNNTAITHPQGYLALAVLPAPCTGVQIMFYRYHHILKHGRSEEFI